MLSVDEAAGTATLTVNPELFDAGILLGAAYTYIDRYYLFLDKREGRFLVTLKAKDPRQADLAALAGDFANELLNQALREKIQQSNRTLQETIVTKALVSADRIGALDSLLDEIQSGAAAGGDIAAPWEESHKER